MKFEKIKNFFKTRTAKSIIVASSALLIGLAILFVFHYFGRLHAHKKWTENRIRR